MIKVFQDFSEAEDIWKSLVPKSQTATLFQTFEWQKNWWEHFGKGKFWLLKIKENEEPIGFASFEEKEGILNFLGTNEVLGGELVTDYGDIVAKSGREEECWREIFEFLKFPKDLHFVREESPSLPVLKKLGAKVEEEDAAPYINLPFSWEDYLLSLPRKKRHELRRKIRRFNGVGFSQSCLSRDWHGDIGDFFNLFRQSFSPKENFLTKEMKDFFQSLGQIFLPQGILELCFLEFEGKKIAATLSFVFKNETLLYNSGFNQEFTSLVPGLILKAQLIKRAIEEGRSRFDFLRGKERYKYDLGGKDQKLYRIRL